MEFKWEKDMLAGIDEDGSQAARVKFRIGAQGNYIIDQVWVDPDHRGQGLAGKITSTFMNKISRANKRVVPRCSFAARYISLHPEYRRLVAQEHPGRPSQNK